jgi:hypothetical protein
MGHDLVKLAEVISAHYHRAADALKLAGRKIGF